MCDDATSQVTHKLSADFVNTWDYYSALVFANAVSKGFRRPGAIVTDERMIVLMHCELSEAIEWIRRGNPQSDHIPEFSGLEEELADLVIRIMDMGEARDLRIAQAVLRKIAYNARREKRHGGKEF